MANTNIKLNVHIPARALLGEKLIFTDAPGTKGTANGLRIPRRYPFADIANLTELRAAGIFRHPLTGGVAVVNTDLGGSAVAGTEGKLGFHLPETEKLVLLVRKGATTAEVFTLKGSTEYSIPDQTVSVPAGAVGDLFQVDLYDFGLYIGGVDGEDGLVVNDIDTTLKFALISRAR